MNRGWYIAKCVVLGLVAVVAVGFITLFLWNWLVPTLFKGPVIDFWQALGLLILSKILFSGLGGEKRNRECAPDDSHADSRNAWKRRFFDKFSNMSAQEREAYKQKMKDKWCSWEKAASKNSAASDASDTDSGKNQ